MDKDLVNFTNFELAQNSIFEFRGFSHALIEIDRPDDEIKQTLLCLYQKSEQELYALTARTKKTTESGSAPTTPRGGEGGPTTPRGGSTPRGGPTTPRGEK